MNVPSKIFAPGRGDLGQPGADGWRSRGKRYQQLLDEDSVQPIRPSLRQESPLEPGVMRVPVDRYLSREIHYQEVEKIWKKVWQMAAREEDIPNVGDYVVYDVADLSWIIVRTGENEFKALRNACMHRGRKLKEGMGRKAKEIRCFFHGWSWEIDGELKNVTCPWDFPDVNADNARLPQAKVGVWQGWIFINPDPQCQPFEDYIGDLSGHFDGPGDQTRRYKRAHGVKLLRCNWKIAQEAFMEAYHVVMTHPQMVPGSGDSNSQYDVFGNFSRAITPGATPSPHLDREASEQEILDNITDYQATGESTFALPEGVSARAFLAEAAREDLRPLWGDGVETISDADLMDSMYFTLFPNFHPWAGFSRINYRFLPYGNDPDMSVMEIMMLDPCDPKKPRPAPGARQFVGADADCADLTDLGGLARVFQQDSANLPKVQLGMKAMNVPGAKAQVQFASYQESKIRHFHKLYNKWMGFE